MGKSREKSREEKDGDQDSGWKLQVANLVGVILITGLSSRSISWYWGYFSWSMTMAPAHKMIKALKGSREARMMLIRDRSRTVWSAVLSSPKMNDADAEQIAKMRNVSPDVLREMSKNRQWVKRYSIAHELVKNPKTPPEVSSKLLVRLKDRDLKRLLRDRNVPEQIRRLAEKRTRRTP